MVFLKNISKENAFEKYGFSHSGLFAKEFIKRGEPVFKCEDECNFLTKETYDKSLGRTRAETLDIIKNSSPEVKEFILRYQIMIDNDLYFWPKDYKDRKLICDCVIFNHSCDPNCGFSGAHLVSIRDIQQNEELTINYQFVATEADLDSGIVCKCGATKCKGNVNYEDYRSIDWQWVYYKYCKSYIKQRIDELKSNWYSTSCYVKRFRKSENAENDEFGLATLKSIKKNELVAKYSNKSSIKYQIRHSDHPTCYLVDDEVYALDYIGPDIELTLRFESD